MKKNIMAFFVTLAFTGISSVSSYAGWVQKGDYWQYETDGNYAADKWIFHHGEHYYVDSEGIMKVGWLQLLDTWYFLNPVHDGTYGKALKGWNWIDGYCYFFQEDGRMLADTLSPDGYRLSETGAWCVEGRNQYVAHKGILTMKTEGGTFPLTRNGGGRGGSSGGNSLGGDWEDEGMTGGGFMDAGLVSGGSLEDSFTPPQIPDENRVGWQVYFVREGNHSVEIFKSQSGNLPEGTELIVDFPEQIMWGGSKYQSKKSSPYRRVLSGDGIQKFYIEFEKEELPPEVDPEDVIREQLSGWLELSRLADETLTGVIPTDGKLITDHIKESNKRLVNLVSMTEDSHRHEIYLIGKNHIPDAFVLGQFPNISSRSELIVDQFTIGEDRYTVLKVGFQVLFPEESCSHRLTTANSVPPGCLTGGSKTERCGKCGFQRTIKIPPAGHKESDQEGRCALCWQMIDGNETPKPMYYELGDLEARQIGDKVYLFSCIDEDYEDSRNNRQKTALFLCQQVIPSDIDSTSQTYQTLSFGWNNNYKTSKVRNWLKTQALDSLFASHTSYTGISQAFTGATGIGDFEEFDETDLVARDRPFQLMEDNIFLLSVEEALKYREYLWKFEGSHENNPKTQYSPHSRGYWLRTPQYTETGGQFQYGMGVYMVDLEQGNIRTAQADDETIGIRPAITVPQSENQKTGE